MTLTDLCFVISLSVFDAYFKFCLLIRLNKFCAPFRHLLYILFYRFSVQFSSVLFSSVQDDLFALGKAHIIMRSTRLSEVSRTLPLKRFQCSSD